jgi:hypothetical protein
LYDWRLEAALVVIGLSILLGFAQVSQTGTVIGLVKLPGGKPSPAARVVLLPPKYTEVWSRQVQQRLDNYWETFKPEFAVNKEHFADYYKLAHSESLRYVMTAMRRDLGDGATKYIKETASTGEFQFGGIPFASYQLLVQGMAAGEDIIWSRTVDVQTNVPIFVDLDRPVS